MSLFFNTPSLFGDSIFDSPIVWTPFTRRTRVPDDSTQQFIQQKREEFDKLSNEFWQKAEQELKQKQEEERKQRQLQLSESKSGVGKDSKALTNTGSKDNQLANRSSGATSDWISSFWNDVESGGMKIDMKDTDTGYTVTATVPGFDRDQLKLEYNDGLLTITGDQSTEEKSSDGSSYSKSSKYVSRSIRLSDPIDRGSVSAKYDNGQLIVELPKLKKTEEKSKDEGIKIQ